MITDHRATDEGGVVDVVELGRDGNGNQQSINLSIRQSINQDGIYNQAKATRSEVTSTTAAVDEADEIHREFTVDDDSSSWTKSKNNILGSCLSLGCPMSRGAGCAKAQFITQRTPSTQVHFGLARLGLTTLRRIRFRRVGQEEEQLKQSGGSNIHGSRKMSNGEHSKRPPRAFFTAHCCCSACLEPSQLHRLLS